MTNAIETDRSRTHVWSVIVTALAVLLLGLLVATVARADERADRLDRKLKVMERVLDEVLVQSPNVVVSGGGATRSLRLDGEGVLFVVAADLIAGRERMRFGEWYVPMPAPAIAPHPPTAFVDPGAPEARDELRAAEQREKEMQAQMLAEQRRIEAEEARIAAEAETLRGSREAREEVRKRSEEAARKNLEGIKRELREALVDYGGTLTELGDGQWLAVALFLGDRGFVGFGEEDERTTMLVRAKISDLKRYNGGDLSRDEALALVTAEQR